MCAFVVAVLTLVETPSEAVCFSWQGHVVAAAVQCLSNLETLGCPPEVSLTRCICVLKSCCVSFTAERVPIHNRSFYRDH